MSFLVLAATTLSTMWTPQQKDLAFDLCLEVFNDTIPVQSERTRYCYCFVTTFSLVTSFVDFLENADFHYANYVLNDNETICFIVMKAGK